MIVLACGSARTSRRWRRGVESHAAVVEVGDAVRLRRVLAAHPSCVVLLDLDLPGLGGLRGLGRLQRASRSAQVIALTGTSRDSEGVAALKAGARGYARRDLSPALLARAVEVVGRGEIWASRALVGVLLDQLSALGERPEQPAVPDVASLERLTRREREVAALIATGASNKDIARRTGLSEKTVKGHLTAIFRKLQVPDRLRLAVLLNELREAR
jgi:DNA-binding NarL/FixJ family response regulator